MAAELLFFHFVTTEMQKRKELHHLKLLNVYTKSLVETAELISYLHE